MRELLQLLLILLVEAILDCAVNIDYCDDLFSRQRQSTSRSMRTRTSPFRLSLSAQQSHFDCRHRRRYALETSRHLARVVSSVLLLQCRTRLCQI